MCPAELTPSKRSELEASFIASLCPLREKLRRCYDEELTSFGLSRSLATPLMHIWKTDGIRQGELAELLDIEGPSLVRLLDQLETSGLVVRRQDPDDQRAKTLHLTAAGSGLAIRIVPVVQRLRAQLLSDVPSKDLEACMRTFERFLGACEHRVSDVRK
ncbi:MAG TPA: MarR family transcriptional regulator [Gemmatimonadaceae bacterium]|jgi:MarR family transcriptional regulator for hemolysin